MSFKKTAEAPKENEHVEDDREGGYDESKIDGSSETEDSSEGNLSGGFDNSSSVQRVDYQVETDGIIKENEPKMAVTDNFIKENETMIEEAHVQSQLLDTGLTSENENGEQWIE